VCRIFDSNTCSSELPYGDSGILDSHVVEGLALGPSHCSPRLNLNCTSVPVEAPLLKDGLDVPNLSFSVAIQFNSPSSFLCVVKKRARRVSRGSLSYSSIGGKQKSGSGKALFLPEAVSKKSKAMVATVS
jgi:hypothetical protein